MKKYDKQDILIASAMCFTVIVVVMLSIAFYRVLNYIHACIN